MKSIFTTQIYDLNTLIKIFIFISINLLLCLSFDNYLLFHTAIELFSVSIGFGIGLIAINSFNYYKNNFFAYLAISFLFIGIVELMHVILYIIWSINNINVSGYQNMYIQLSVSAKDMRIVSFILALYSINKKPHLIKIGFIYFLSTIGIYLSIFVFKIFPTCYVNFHGITQFKLENNFILIILGIYALFLLKNKKKEFKPKVYKLLFLYMLFLVFSDLVYIVYIENYNISHLISHYFKFISFCMLYSVVIKITLKEPYECIFRQLSEKAEDMKKLNEILKIKNIELEKTKSNIKKSMKKYKKVLELLPDSVVIREGMKISYVNSAFIKTFKFKRKEDVINKDIFSVFNEDGNRVIKRKMKESSEFEFIPFKREELYTVDGQIVETEVSSVVIELDNKKSIINLIRSVEERNQYERLKMELEEKDNLRIEFFANICHELRTPINVIYSALQLQDIYIEQKNVELMDKYNDIAKQNCYRMLKLCNNLIDINKLDSGFIQPMMKIYNIVELVENITSSVIPYVKSKNLKLIFDTNTEEKYIQCDSNFMERILLNLLSNSIKFSTEDGTIWVKVFDRKKEVVIVVKDNGIGIPENKQKAIFERFIQADKSFKRKCEGSGIGLSLVKSFVELQGGTIECLSKEGRGTEFIIKFPVSQASEESAASTEKNEISSYKIGDTVCVEFSDIYFN